MLLDKINKAFFKQLHQWKETILKIMIKFNYLLQGYKVFFEFLLKDPKCVVTSNEYVFLYHVAAYAANGYSW